MPHKSKGGKRISGKAQTIRTTLKRKGQERDVVIKLGKRRKTKKK